MAYSVSTEIQNLKRSDKFPHLKLISTFKKKVIQNRDNTIHLQNSHLGYAYRWITVDNNGYYTWSSSINQVTRNYDSLSFSVGGDTRRSWVKVIVYLYEFHKPEELNSF